jgi:hypothetical protein
MAGGSEPERIELEIVEAAIRLVRDYFWPHSRAALRQIGLNERHANTRRVLRWIKALGKHEVSREGFAGTPLVKFSMPMKRNICLMD